MAMTVERVNKIKTDIGHDDAQMDETRRARAADSKPVKKDISPAEAMAAVRRAYDGLTGTNGWSSKVLETYILPPFINLDQLMEDLGHEGTLYVFEVARLGLTNVISGETLRDGIRHEAEIRKQRTNRRFLAYSKEA